MDPNDTDGAIPAPTAGAPPAPPRLPEKTRLEGEVLPHRFLVRFPAGGCGCQVILLGAFALAWWSFLLISLAAVILSPLLPPAPDPTATATPTVTTATATTEAGEGEPQDLGFLLLFLSPFFLAGLALLAGVFWPLFGRVTVCLDEFEGASWRAAVFGLGWTRRAPLAETTVRWSESPFREESRYRGCLVLALGAREIRLGGTISREEQAWLLREMNRALEKLRGSPPPPGPGTFPPGAPGPGEPAAPGQPPPPGVVRHEYTADGGLNLYFARSGLDHASCGMFFFTTFWNLITLVVSLGFLLAEREGPISWLMVLFFVPFYLIGLGTLGWAIWTAWGRTAMRLGPEGLAVIKQLFAWSRQRLYPLESIGEIKREIAYHLNDRPVHAVVIRAGGRKVRLGTGLPPEHQEWLIGELRAALADLRGRA